MKQLSIIILLFLAIGLQGQDTTHYPNLIITNSGRIKAYHDSISTKRVTDTIKVVLLVSDTVHHFDTYYKSSYIEGSGKEEIIGKDTLIQGGKWTYKEINKDEGNYGSGNVYWTYGYEVREDHYEIRGTDYRDSIIQTHRYLYYEHLKYLDAKKKELKSTIIIWQSVPAMRATH